LGGGGNPEVFTGPGGFQSFFKFAKGGIVYGGGNMPQLAYSMPSGYFHKFARGGQVKNGPVMGIIGEEGDEIVARMKPGKSSDFKKDGSGDIQQNIFLVDQRRPNLAPNDVEFIITDSIERGRSVGKSVKNTLKRTQNR
jgi:hypothetical protein